ncbi:MAG: hypothetical protein JXQ87_10720 [Bacteroidia bacterium]
MKKIVLGLGLAAFMMIGGVSASYAVIANEDASTVLVEKEKEKDKDKKKRKGKKAACCSAEEKAKCEGKKEAAKGGCCASKKEA